MTEIEKAWLAAVVDSEGTIGLTKNTLKKKRVITKDQVTYIRYSALMMIVNTNYEFIDRCQKLIGSNEAKHRRNARFGKKEVWGIFLRNRAQLLSVLRDIEPYLIIKRELSRRLIEWLEWFERNRVIGTGLLKKPRGMSIKDRVLKRDEYDAMAEYVRSEMSTFKVSNSTAVPEEVLHITT
jgi:hypothetical protein